MAGNYLRADYPLNWPKLQPRTKYRRSSSFKVSLSRAWDEMLRELLLLNAKDIVISSGVRTRKDGVPYADSPNPDDPGVAVYFDRETGAYPNRKRVPFVVACDSYWKAAENIRAVGVTIEALRAIQRHGATEMLEQAFTGFAALPLASNGKRAWWEVLELDRAASKDAITTRYRELAKVHHPDAGGSSVRMAEINDAYHAAIGGAR